MNREQGRKKSNFIEVNSVPAGAYMDVFFSGVNRKISYDNFLSGLGVTGTIEQDGSVTGVAVLDTQGTVNYIRNLEAGNGISLSVSPENGIEIEHNFAQGSTGSPLVVDLNVAQPTFVGLVGGAGISLNYNSTNATITINATGGATPSTVVVTSINDFPTAVGGVITLDANKQYLISNNINLGTTRLELQDGTEVNGAGPFVTTLTYTGTGALFTWEDSRVVISNLGISAVNGSLFDGSDPLGQKAALLDKLYVIECDSIGSFSDMSILKIEDVEIAQVNTNGMTFAGTFDVLTFAASVVKIGAGALFDFGTAVFSGIDIMGNVFDITDPSVELLKGAVSSGNIATGGIGALVNNRILTNTPALTNISADNRRWWFFINDRLKDSRNDGTVSMQGNSTATTIGSTSTPVLVAGTFTVGAVAGFSVTTAGRLTFTAEKPERLPVDAQISLTAAGTNQDVSIYIAKNGSVIAGSRMSVNAGANVAHVSTSWQVDFVLNDYVEIFVQNATATNAVTVTRAVLRVN